MPYARRRTVAFVRRPVRRYTARRYPARRQYVVRRRPRVVRRVVRRRRVF